MASNISIEKFSLSELSSLRTELMQSGIDSWQAADVVSCFLTGRGYGVNTHDMRNAVSRIEVFHGSTDSLQAVLETVAYVM